ncbi:MAG: sigma-54 dependent transcriptional regulator [Bdellovibrionaceae bacterium]|nr:sigma-54 dependent transcriptional regulator [Pseudobdellovibrionaceae bacterium]MDW8189398.1 sigma-54 dependent transcriptional regulator [Pseudobdellovibrionaceae bacterium]
MKPRILVVDDEESIREFLEIMLKKEGYEVSLAEDGEQGREFIKNKTFDMVISDLQMPKLNGLELLKWTKQNYPDITFMMITAFGTTESAVEAMKMGAYDYITKPFKIDEVKIVIANALKAKHLEVENRVLRKELKATFSFQQMVGNSEAMHRIFDLIQRVSQAPSNVIITGESGTGKEMVAKAIHYNGALKDRPFVSVNCGAIPEALIESELFGHKKGAFTSAIADKAGLFEVANGGTLFLDEVGELPLSVQVKLLRALQERVIRRLGANDDIKIDVRIIAATNRDLQKMVAEGTFRQDLFYRLNVIHIHLPPLRERKEDIPLLVNFFVKKFNERLGKNISGVSQEAMDLLMKYHYPGNVRELENIIERTMALETGSIILPESLPPLSGKSSEPDGAKFRTTYEIELDKNGIDLEKVLGQIEKELILKAIHLAGGVKKNAAKLLKVTPRSMRYRCDKYNLGPMEDEAEDI